MRLISVPDGVAQYYCFCFSCHPVPGIYQAKAIVDKEEQEKGVSVASCDHVI